MQSDAHTWPSKFLCDKYYNKRQAEIKIRPPTTSKASREKIAQRHQTGTNSQSGHRRGSLPCICFRIVDVLDSYRIILARYTVLNQDSRRIYRQRDNYFPANNVVPYGLRDGRAWEGPAIYRALKYTVYTVLSTVKPMRANAQRNFL